MNMSSLKVSNRLNEFELNKNRSDTKSNKSITNTTFCLYKSLTRIKGNTLLFSLSGADIIL